MQVACAANAACTDKCACVAPNGCGDAVINGVLKQNICTVRLLTFCFKSIAIARQFVGALNVSLLTLQKLVNGLTWKTTYNGILGTNPWVITNGGSRIRFNVEKSKDCGGQNGNTQSGTATANIVVGAAAVWFNFDLSGWGELEAEDYDKMTLVLDGSTVGYAHAAGGGSGCHDGPVVFERSGTWPMKFEAGSTHSFVLYFTTEDPYFHVTSYYELELTLDPV